MMIQMRKKQMSISIQTESMTKEVVVIRRQRQVMTRMAYLYDCFLCALLLSIMTTDDKSSFAYNEHQC